MDDLKIKNLTEPQIAAFREVMPALHATGLVTATKSSVTIKHHPAVFRRPDLFTGPALSEAVARSSSLSNYTGKASVLNNLLDKLYNS